MSFSDHDAINFTDPNPHELKYILYTQLNKRATIENMALLKKIGADFKSENGVKIITHRQDFYDYAKNHDSYLLLEDAL